MKKLCLLFLIGLLATLGVSTVSTPVFAAVTEPLRLNVYIPSEINNWWSTITKATGDSWEVKATNGKTTIPLPYVSTSNGLHHYMLSNSSSASSAGWTITVRYKPNCKAGPITDWYCEPYNLTSAKHDLYVPSRWDIKVSGLPAPYRRVSEPTWTPVSKQTLRPEPTVATTAPSTGPTLTLTGVLKHITNAGLPYEDKIWYLDPSSGNNLSMGPNAAKWVWDPANSYIVGKTYACNYKGSLSAATDISCKEGTVPPPDTSTPPGGTSGTGSEPAGTTGGPLVAEWGTFDNSILTAGSSGCTTGSAVYTRGLLKDIPCNGAIDSPDEVLTFVKNVVTVILLPTVGIIFLIMLLIGGILYITSRGNQTQLDRGKKTLTAAIIGLLIVTLSYTLIAIFASLIGGGTT